MTFWDTLTGRRLGQTPALYYGTTPLGFFPGKNSFTLAKDVAEWGSGGRGHPDLQYPHGTGNTENRVGGRWKLDGDGSVGK